MHRTTLLLCAMLTACPCDQPSDTETCPDCSPIEQGQPYGPCDPDVGCTDHEANVCIQSADATMNVCAKTCLSDDDCAAIPYCTPDDGPKTCSTFAWCVVEPDPSSGLCPVGMLLEPLSGVCMWPKP